MTSLFIQVPAFEEPDTLPGTLREINDQPVPDCVFVTREVWVTRSEDEYGCCSTWQAAESVPGWDIYEAPAGKLSARNAAHDHALASGADLIMPWDADAPPLADDTLRLLVEAALEDGVALANSETSARDGSLIGVLTDFGSSIEDSVAPHVHGQCHCMTAEAWEKAGPFDTDLDQTNIGSVRAEEEFDFRHRVAEVGEVVDVSGAVVHNDPRRSACAIPTNDDPFCERIGEETF